MNGQDPSTLVHINRAHWPVTSLGPGNRVGIWFQGCSIGCKGCCSRDTWDPDSVQAISVSEVLAWVSSLSLDSGEGITISGGEPFDQADALKTLLVGLRGMEKGFSGNIILYSGYSWGRIARFHHEVLPYVDLLVSGPYSSKHPATRIMGSTNQRCHALTVKGAEVLAQWQQSQLPHLQLHVDRGTIWMIGIPRTGDLERLEERLATAGIEIGTASWRA